MLETKYVGDSFEMLVTVLADFVANILYLLALASGISIQKMSPISKFCHQHPKIVNNIYVAQLKPFINRLDFIDYIIGFVFVNFNVIIGFVFGALKTSFRCRYMRFFKKEMNFDYDRILAANILESMRAVNVTKVVDDIATFTWENIPVVSQEGFPKH